MCLGPSDQEMSRDATEYCAVLLFFEAYNYVAVCNNLLRFTWHVVLYVLLSNAHEGLQQMSHDSMQLLYCLPVRNAALAVVSETYVSTCTKVLLDMIELH